MYLKQNVKPLKTPLILQSHNIACKANWFNDCPLGYKKHLYDDIFIRRYVKIFFSRWSKMHNFKVLGSLYIFRTLGKLYINLSFFNPIVNFSPKKNFHGKGLVEEKILVSFGDKTKIEPIAKYKKQLLFSLFSYRLEELLNVQVFFKVYNICNTYAFQGRLMKTILTRLVKRFSYGRKQFDNGSLYINTISILVHILKFKRPDSLILANYIALVLTKLQRHTHFLIFIKKIIQSIQRIFVFGGVRILISGKLNGFSRATSKYIQAGRVTTQCKDLFYSRADANSFTRGGKMGVKV
jgi:hypothetical protein